MFLPKRHVQNICRPKPKQIHGDCAGALPRRNFRSFKGFSCLVYMTPRRIRNKTGLQQKSAHAIIHHLSRLQVRVNKTIVDKNRRAAILVEFVGDFALCTWLFLGQNSEPPAPPPHHHHHHQQQSSTTIINDNHQQQSSTTIINNDKKTTTTNNKQQQWMVCQCLPAYPRPFFPKCLTDHFRCGPVAEYMPLGPLEHWPIHPEASTQATPKAKSSMSLERRWGMSKIHV